MKNLVASSLGLVKYADAWDLQKRMHLGVADGILPNLLLLLEHPHVYTLGRRGSSSDILAGPETLAQLGIDVHHVDRGGEVTYHGPGQLVGYPIIDLRAWGDGPLQYVRALEEVMIATLAEFGIDAGSDRRPTGVWVGHAKIGAIGVKISRGVSFHGFALNVEPDLSYFDHIVPCGMPDVGVTSMSAQGASNSTVSSVIPVLARHFGRVFGWPVRWSGLEELNVYDDATLAPGIPFSPRTTIPVMSDIRV